jgi:uroporphyrinogen decarboxylase
MYRHPTDPNSGNLHSPNNSSNPPHSPYLLACRGQRTATIPIWLMRQAGRYLPEYREIRKHHDFLEMCRDPELIREVTVQPIRRFGMDAAILFSDILIPLVPMGAELTFGKNSGPSIANTVRRQQDMDAILTFDPQRDLDFVLEGIRLIRAELPPETALIGFSGAPFTLACYWIEGGKPEPFAHTKQLMYRQPELFAQFLDRLGKAMTGYLAAMIEAGADAVQLFDTWAGILPVHEFEQFNLPVLRSIFDGLRSQGVPMTYFAKSSDHLLPVINRTGCTVAGLDWRSSIREASKALGEEVAIQGNLDPTVLLGDENSIRKGVRRVLDDASGRDGFIFNLGHGILPMTPVESVTIMLDEIRNH